jgi:hypothetical protein
MIIKKVNAGIAVIKRMKTCVPQKFLQTVYNALIQPYFDYCYQLWDTCGIGLKEKLQKWGGGGVNRGTVYKSANSPKFEAKSAIRQWSCLNLNPLKALL